jgi:hypothetical protein
MGSARGSRVAAAEDDDDETEEALEAEEDEEEGLEGRPFGRGWRAISAAMSSSAAADRLAIGGGSGEREREREWVTWRAADLEFFSFFVFLQRSELERVQLIL